MLEINNVTVAMKGTLSAFPRKLPRTAQCRNQAQCNTSPVFHTAQKQHWSDNTVKTQFSGALKARSSAAYKASYTVAPYTNPLPDVLRFDDTSAISLCNALDDLHNSLSPEEGVPEEVYAVVSPVLLWIRIAHFAHEIRGMLHKLREDARNLALLNIVWPFLKDNHPEGASLFSQSDTVATHEALEKFLQVTLERCDRAFETAEFMARALPQEKNKIEEAKGYYEDIGLRDTPWSILDFNFLPLRDLLCATHGKSPLTFEPNGFVATDNGMGYMTSCLDPFSNAFTKHSQHYPKLTKPSLEIGAAFGVASIPTLRAGGHLVANDLSDGQLRILRDLTPLHLRNQLKTTSKRFPEELSFPKESFSAILVARVLHFFTIAQVERSAKLLAEWLEPGGHLFVVTDSPYLGNARAFVKDYESRKAAGSLYPGLLEDVPSVFTSRTNKLPPLFHFFDPDVLTRVFTDVGLEVVNCRFFPCYDYPADVQGDGREGVGLIARKPSLNEADH